MRDYYCGVYQRGQNRYHAIIKIAGHKHALGAFDTEFDAAQAIDNAKYWLQDFLPRGPMHLNFPEQPIKAPSEATLRLRRDLFEWGFPRVPNPENGFVPPE